MLTININGIDVIDREEIRKHYRYSQATVHRRLMASGIQPMYSFKRYFYPLVPVLEYFDALPPVMPAGSHLHKKKTHEAK